MVFELQFIQYLIHFLLHLCLDLDKSRHQIEAVAIGLQVDELTVTMLRHRA